MIAFNIETAGEHSIEFKYAPKTFTLGLAISLLSLSLFVFIIIFEKPLAGIWTKISDEIDTRSERKNTKEVEDSAESIESDSDNSEGTLE